MAHIVPKNIIICSLNPPDYYGVIKSLVKYVYKSNLFEDMFRLKTKISESFKFNKNLHDLEDINTKFASWYYQDNYVQYRISIEAGDKWSRKYNYEIPGKQRNM